MLNEICNSYCYTLTKKNNNNNNNTCYYLQTNIHRNKDLVNTAKRICFVGSKNNATTHYFYRDKDNYITTIILMPIPRKII